MMREARTIDMAINRISRAHFKRQAHRTTHAHELHQFASLFDPSYLSKLAQLFFRNDKHNHDGLNSHYYAVEVGWIDKKPLVAYSQTANLPKVELGDALLVYNHLQIDQDGKYIDTVDERAVIIQAKVTGNKALPPKVTVTKGESSRKEYVLYSKWPSFMLKRKKTYTTTFNLPHPLQNNEPFPYAFYLAARKSYNKHPNWRCHWMGAPTKLSERCNISAGDILLSLKTGLQIGKYQVGADLKSNREWSRLVKTVLMDVACDRTNSGWCGIIMPTRIKGSHIQLIQPKFHRYHLRNGMRLNMSLQQLSPNKVIAWQKPFNHFLKPEVDGNFSGKLMILRVSRISSEFPLESINFD